MVSTPFGLNAGSNALSWNLDIGTIVGTNIGDLSFNSNGESGGRNMMSINNNFGGIAINTYVTSSLSDTWAVQINHDQNPGHQTGMRVTNDGFFEITNRINGYAGTARLHSGGVWFTQSDLKTKKDVETASNLLDKALSLNPINFYYKKQDLDELPHKLMGFIAQEVEEILPHAVVGIDTKFLDYNAIVPVAIGAIKEMKEYYDDKIANLEMQLEQLKKILLNNQMAA